MSIKVIPPVIANARSHGCSQSSQAVHELGISRTAVYELITAGKIKTVKIGRRRLIPSEAIEGFIAGLTAA
jgi:excisionase family DNA binding protein